MNLYNEKQRKLDQIAKIQKLPQSERWRAIRDMLRAINPRIRVVDDKFIEKLNETRNSRLNDFGSNKAMDTRFLLDLPTYMYEALITMDQDFLTAINSKDNQVVKTVWRKLAQVFPEYKIARII